MSRRCRIVLLTLLALWPHSVRGSSILNFPRLSFEENTLTGVAIVNPSGQDALVTITAYGEDGQPLADATNPVQVTIPANQQFSKLASELFGTSVDPDAVAWFQATSSIDGLTGFFLFLNLPFPSTLFDGADLPPSDRQIVFTQARIESGESTELNIINPNTAIANLQLDLIRPNSLPLSKTLSLPANGVVRLDTKEFFGITETPAGSFIKVSSNVDIAGFQFVNTADGDLVGLNARSADEQLTHLFFPQLAVLGSWETTVGIVNNSNQAVILTITAFKPDGTIYDTANLQSNPVTRSLNPGESLAEDVEAMFGFQGENILDGWLQVESTSESVTGFVSYGTPQTGSLATVSPSRDGQTRAIFSHIATANDFFTGVAVLNAGQLAANIRILAITRTGSILGSFNTVLQPGQRTSGLINEFIPEAANQSGGLIWVKSDLPVHLTSLFGSTQVLANIPPQVAPDIYTPDAALQSIQVNPPLAIVQPANTQSFSVAGGIGATVWKVNGVEGGNPTAGTINPSGVYTAPSAVPSPQVVTVSVEVGVDTAGASVDVLEKDELLTSERIIQSVAYLGSLEKIYTAELAILSFAANGPRPLAVEPTQEFANSEIFEVATAGAAKQLLTTFGGETISKMISFTASTGREFLLLAGQNTGRIVRLDPVTLESLDIATGLNEPSSIVIDPTTGDLLIAEKDQVTSVAKASLEAGLVSLARTAAGAPEGARPSPQAIALLFEGEASGLAVDQCTGNIYISDGQLGVIREFVALTGELRELSSGFQRPGQLLAVYRDGVGCPASFELLVIELAADRVTLVVPRTQLVTPWISALQSTDLSFLPGGNQFALTSSILLPEFIGNPQAQQVDDRYSLRTIELRQHRKEATNSALVAPKIQPTTPLIFTPRNGETIPQTQSGFQFKVGWTPSASPAGDIRYRLLIQNRRAPRPLVDTILKETEFLVSSDSPITDENLDDWGLLVVAIDALNNHSNPSRRVEVNFAECFLDDGLPCFAGADLSIVKSDDPDPVSVGGLISYTIDVTNNGPANASGVFLTDRLPVQLSFVSAKPEGVCSQSSGSEGVVNCKIGDLANGATATVAILGQVRASAVGATLVNFARVLAVEDDPDYSNNGVTEETRVLKGTPLADLTIVKRDSADPVLPGDFLTYTLTITNRGPAFATRVTLADELPSGVTFVALKATDGTCETSRGTVKCSIKEIPPESTVTIALSVKVNTANAKLLNVATVKAVEDDPNNGNNTASEVTVVEGISVTGIDLSVSKTDLQDPVAAGDTLTYQVDVANAGPDLATEVVMVDALPPDVTLTAFKTAQGECSETGGGLTCKLGVLESGGSAQILIVVNVGSGAAGSTLLNSVKVGASQPDSNGDNNFAQEQTTVVLGKAFGADVYVKKTDSQDPVKPGQDFTYTLVVGNAGPDAATDVTLTDQLPPEAKFLATKSTQGICFGSAGAVECSLGTIESGGAATVVIAVSLSSSTTVKSIANVATVKAAEPDPNELNNTAREETSILQAEPPAPAEADLVITKSDSPDPVEPGGELVYTVTITNEGPGTANKIVMTDGLPAVVEFSAVKTTQGSCSHAAGTVQCDLGSLEPGTSASVAIVVIVSTEATGPLANKVVVEAAEPDPDATSNTASAETAVLDVAPPPPPEADLSVSKTGTPNPVQAGGTLTYTITVKNAGPDPANKVTVVDSLPSVAEFVAAKASQGGCGHDAGVVKCALGSLAPGGSATVAIGVAVAASATGTIGNKVSVTGAETDPNPSNNAASAQISVEGVAPPPEPPQADLSLSKSDSPDPVEPGGNLTYTITVKNAGPDTANKVSVSDVLPSVVKFVTSKVSQGTCAHEAGTVRCSLGALTAGGSAVIVIGVGVSASATATIGNKVSVTAAETDPDLSNNGASTVTTVQSAAPPPATEADLSVSKSDSPDPVNSGATITYGITVRNAGPGTANKVTMTDSLPSEVKFLAAETSQGACANEAGVVQCGLGSIASGGSATVAISAAVGSPATDTIGNKVSVTGAETDPNLSNNSASAQTTVETVTTTTTTTVTTTTSTTTTTLPPRADLQVTKSAPASVRSGDTLSYSIRLINNGPDSATKITLTDQLPVSQVAFSSLTTTLGSCTKPDAKGVIKCNFEGLKPKASASVTISVSVGKLEAGTTITNTVSVAAAQEDPNPKNNSDGVTTNVTVF